jgi:TPR repeat protein
MRCVLTALAIFGSALLLHPHIQASAAPIDLETIIEGETAAELCDRLAADPFAGFGPEAWSQPFSSIDYYRAGPACIEAMKLKPNEPRFALGAALAHIAGKQDALAKQLLNPLVAANNTSAMLALAFILPDEEAAQWMRKAAEAGSTPGMILFGMSELTGSGTPEDQVDGLRMIRRAAEAGSTRAMLILANFYNEGALGVGYNPAEAKRLIAEAAKLGDPRAKDMLASLDQDAKQ